MKVRIKFAKYGPVKFIGHLDVMRYFQKAIRRAEIDIAYSEGFSPHQIMSFAAPLSVGHTSEGEYFDIELNSITDEKDVQSRLQSVMVEGIDILQVQVLPVEAGNAMASVEAADYLISFRNGTILPDDWQNKLMEFYAQPAIMVMKPTKKSEKEIDLKESIYQLEIRENATDRTGKPLGDSIYMMLNASSGGNIKPAFVIEAFLATIPFEIPPFSLLVHRLETYQNIGTQENKKFVGLIWEK